jgi:hypothetical protein
VKVPSDEAVRETPFRRTTNSVLSNTVHSYCNGSVSTAQPRGRRLLFTAWIGRISRCKKMKENTQCWRRTGTLDKHAQQQVRLSNGSFEEQERPMAYSCCQVLRCGHGPWQLLRSTLQKSTITSLEKVHSSESQPFSNSLLKNL